MDNPEKKNKRSMIDKLVDSVDPKKKMQDQIDSESAESIERANNRDELKKQVNERMNKIEDEMANGEYVTKEDLTFVIDHGTGPNGGDFTKYKLMERKKALHYEKENEKITEEESKMDKESAARAQQRDIDNTITELLDSMNRDMEDSRLTPEKIKETKESIENLNELSNYLQNRKGNSQKIIDDVIDVTKDKTSLKEINDSASKIKQAIKEKDEKTQEEERM